MKITIEAATDYKTDREGKRISHTEFRCRLHGATSSYWVGPRGTHGECMIIRDDIWQSIEGQKV